MKKMVKISVPKILVESRILLQEMSVEERKEFFKDLIKGYCTKCGNVDFKCECQPKKGS